MKILIVHSGNNNITNSHTFVKEQVNSLNKLGLETTYLTIEKKGIKGYLLHLPKLYKKIKEFKPDIIHAHYGLSGLFANLQRKVPVITTFHGSDVYNARDRRFSKIAFFLSQECIFVSQKLKSNFGVKKGHVITCGVDMQLFKPISNLKKESFILFSGSIDNKVKNFPLASEGIKLYNERFSKSSKKLDFVELKNKSRSEVVQLMNTAELLLITSIYEGSSQVLKEAMACNCPVVTTDVGSVRDLISENSKAGVIVDPESESIASGIQKVLSENFENGRHELIEHEISLDHVAQRILTLYKKVVASDKKQT